MKTLEGLMCTGHVNILNYNDLFPALENSRLPCSPSSGYQQYHLPQHTEELPVTGRGAREGSVFTCCPLYISSPRAASLGSFDITVSMCPMCSFWSFSEY